jgi:hypothetical protein
MEEPAKTAEFELPTDRLDRMQDEVLERLGALDQEILSLLEVLASSRDHEAA